MDYKKIQEVVGYKYKNEDLLKEALTHRSYLNENHTWHLPHNERIEFLGDAVLELIVTEELFNRFSDQSEGWMTSIRASLVNTVMLASVGARLNLEEYILMSQGEKRDNSRAKESILANTMEALIGSMYLDGGYETARKFIKKNIIINLEKIIQDKSYIDPKSLLQEKVQSIHKVTPHYQVLADEGPDHEKVFTVGVYFGERLVAQGKGPSKQEGETVAAKMALELIDSGQDKV
ncbi:MAG: ribonuclease III [Candidatus Harrisonbacteria bacterium CG10_big_fil_rev_8_21_14_0_10_38_8]|uniref:Ribonuclease 3 n=1 Tax=Candidatus Harrisonbacteria bacterium CG10_big_fil_rev_8_21_14_0_10_38_8 TaxID=1974582 RepID=A0A2M6WKQ7_9BACT|nr:MAG: ribonuclease III [Candidatus Harrisonbacteria bacterium CG10_big_fil_rev_8_21_14_0_10_38_8]